MRKIFKTIGNKISLSIFQKLIFSFVLLVSVPLTVSFYTAQKTASELVVSQISSETMNSIELISGSVNTLLQKMYSLALFVNDDGNIHELLNQELTDSTNAQGLSGPALAVRKLDRINKYSSTISNLSFNMIGMRSYITIVTGEGSRHTNWAYENRLPDSFLERAGDLAGGIWLAFEENYTGEAKQYPYVITVGKNILRPWDKKPRGTLLISVAEQSFRELLAVHDAPQTRMILDQDFNIIVCTRDEWLGNNFADLFENGFPSNANGTFHSVDPSGSRVIVTYDTRRNWIIADVKTYDSMTRQMSAQRDKLLLVNSLFMLVFIVMAALIARGISRPLQRLARLMLGEDAAQNMPQMRDEVVVLENSFHIMREKNRFLMKENIDTERKKRDAELKALQAQISPHFLFNTLTAIRWAAINKHNKKAANMVLALSNLLRMTIVKNDEFITLEEEFENLRHYAALLQMRYAMTFDLSFSADGSLLTYQIPKLLLQPLVENAIIHGFEGIPEGGCIEIIATNEDGDTHIKICDNGRGMPEDAELYTQSTKDLKFSGIGISNVEERIKLYFGEQYGLQFAPGAEGGTVVTVILPTLQEGEGGERHV